MTTETQTPTFRIHAAASILHVAARLVALVVIVGVLAGGFLAGLKTPSAAAPEQTAARAAACGARPC
ncbi:MAG: hypothetical protein NDI82_12620 [Anaeromyxobacteraceae bacterium]|nr:hypothetical protein [Anaeromyxobacteraceae bacterium]